MKRNFLRRREKETRDAIDLEIRNKISISDDNDGVIVSRRNNVAIIPTRIPSLKRCANGMATKKANVFPMLLYKITDGKVDKTFCDSA